MATIECCVSLSNATKAKLQDTGILYLADLTRLLNCDDDLGEDARSTQVLANLKRRVTQRLLLQVREADTLSKLADENGAGPASATAMDTTAVTPIDSVAFFTEKEVDEVVEAVREVREENAEFLRRHDINGSSYVSTISAAVAGCSSSLSNSSAEKSSVTLKGAARIPGCRSLREILADATERQLRGQATHATTFSRALDTLLGGGVAVGGVSEVSGPPGVGKTQLLMQLAVSCAMPVDFGGLGGTCVFVDTEGSFVAERLEQMATAAAALVATILAKSNPRHGPRDSARPGDAGDNQSTHPHPNHRSPLCEALTRKRTRSASLGTAARNTDESEDKPLLPVVTDGEPTASTSRSATAKAAAMRRPPTAPNDFTVASVLQRVRYVRVTELTDFLAFLYSLPLWLSSEQSTVPTAGSPTATGGDSPLQCDVGDVPVRMVLVDSIALPFRAADTFEKSASSCEDTYGSTSSGLTSPLSGVNGASHGALSKQGLWQRSRLLYQCSTTLEELASSYQLAVVVSNHMTTKLLRPTTNNGQASRDAESNNSFTRQTVLIPALGDAWGHGLSTRLLLTYHHYDLPSCAFMSGTTDTPQEDDKGCQEDIVYSTATSILPSTAPSLVDRVVQHRVARLLKASGRPRCETCFLITSKGVRDVRKDMVRKWVAPQSSATN
ncbi:putative Recombinase Rad51 [Leptomonas pyrrhocoris]|uniref:DNA repair protein RAD51 homolog 3 n=1 Tax=Leptomonas pyrrhocoris TaxID=157538 RepID=A0A0N0DW50_LEPPY|nr:putative Recombinase Rad51 [Leptomonas pyrrhocoris]KPA81054.1 putative Recombinase Rad51 [Leptomonas pyrrhocoris]|eukprot:XP_015659493.1 putative Recombinase Rad51 [Leptomonas pyrrhocoris]